MDKPHTLIVGGTRGLGWGTARLLVRSGHRVSVLSRNPVTAEKTIKGVHYYAMPAHDIVHANLAVRELVGKGHLSNLVFFQRWRGPKDESNEALWENEFATSLTLTRQIIDVSVPRFSKSGGAIVLISSIASQLAVRNVPVSYHVAKAGMNQLTRCYAATLGPRNIRVNSISPGTVVKEEAREYYCAKKMVDFYKRLIPLGRLPTSDELARLVKFFLEDATCVTGQDLVMDGGVSIQSQESLVKEMMGA